MTEKHTITTFSFLLDLNETKTYIKGIIYLKNKHLCHIFSEYVIEIYQRPL